MPSPTDYKNTLRVPRAISSIGAGTFDALLEKANGVNFEGTNDEPQKVLVDVNTPMPNTLRELPKNVVLEGIHGHQLIFPDDRPNAKLKPLGKGFTDEALRGKVPLVRNAKTANTYAGGSAGYITGAITATSSSLEWDMNAPDQPTEISTRFFGFDNTNTGGFNNADKRTNLLEKIALCNVVVKADKFLKIIAYPDTIKRRTTLNLGGGGTAEQKNPQNNIGAEFFDNRHIHFTTGEYLNTWNNVELVAGQSTVPCFQFQNNFVWTQDKLSRVHVSNVDKNVWLLHPHNQVGAYENLKIDGMYLYQADVVTATGGSTFFTGNTRGVDIRNVVCDNVKGYFTIGGLTNSPTPVKYASLVTLANLKFINCPTQIFHLLNVVGCTGENIQFKYDEGFNYTKQDLTISPFDLEGDFEDSVIRDIYLSKIIFDMKAVTSPINMLVYNAMAIQGTRHEVKNFNIKDISIKMNNQANLLIGLDAYGVDGFNLENAYIENAYGNAVRIRACKNANVKNLRGKGNGDYEGGGAAYLISEGNIDSHFEDIKASDAVGGVYEREARVTASSDGTDILSRGTEIRDYSFLVGKKINFNGVEYTIVQNNYGWTHKVKVNANVPALAWFNVSVTAGNRTTFSKTNHGLNTGALVRFLGAMRYIIRTDADNFQTAATYADAEAGVFETVAVGSTGNHQLIPYFESRWANNTYNVKNLSQIVGSSKDVRALEAAAPMGALPTITGATSYNPNDSAKRAFAKLFATQPPPAWHANRFFYFRASDLVGVVADGTQLSEIPNSIAGQTFKFTQATSNLRGTFHLGGGNPYVLIRNDNGYTGNEDFPSTAGGFAFAIIGSTQDGINSGHHIYPLHNAGSGVLPSSATWYLAPAYFGNAKWYNGGDVASYPAEFGTRQIIIGRTGATSHLYVNGVDQTDDNTKTAKPTRLHMGDAFALNGMGVGMKVEAIVLWNDDLSDDIAAEFYADHS